MATIRKSINQLICIFWHNPLLLAFLMSAALLAGAYGFQYIGGYPPCDLCWSQRYAHMAILVFSGAGLLLKGKVHGLYNSFAFTTILALVASVVAAGYHAGVEQKWWLGPTTCTSHGMSQSMDMEALFDNMVKTKLVLCDEISWDLFGISMAGYNFLFSLATTLFVIFSVLSYLRNKRAIHKD